MHLGVQCALQKVFECCWKCTWPGLHLRAPLGLIENTHITIYSKPNVMLEGINCFSCGASLKFHLETDAAVDNAVWCCSPSFCTHWDSEMGEEGMFDQTDKGLLLVMIVLNEFWKVLILFKYCINLAFWTSLLMTVPQRWSFSRILPFFCLTLRKSWSVKNIY